MKNTMMEKMREMRRTVSRMRMPNIWSREGGVSEFDMLDVKYKLTSTDCRCVDFHFHTCLGTDQLWLLLRSRPLLIALIIYVFCSPCFVLVLRESFPSLPFESPGKLITSPELFLVSYSW